MQRHELPEDLSTSAGAGGLELLGKKKETRGEWLETRMAGTWGWDLFCTHGWFSESHLPT